MPFFNSAANSDADSSKTNSPPSSPQRRPLTISNVSNIFVRMKRVRSEKDESYSQQQNSYPVNKPHRIESFSASSPLTNPVLVGKTCTHKEPLLQRDTFICAGAVDVPRLLRASRISLLEKAMDIGANALVDERWICTISEPKNRSNGNYRVQIRYSACATRAQRADPGVPIALDKARSVPGLMTILERE